MKIKEELLEWQKKPLLANCLTLLIKLESVYIDGVISVISVLDTIRTTS